MPSRIPRACRKRGCTGTITDSSGYCDKHRVRPWLLGIFVSLGNLFVRTGLQLTGYKHARRSK